MGDVNFVLHQKICRKNLIKNDLQLRFANTFPIRSTVDANHSQLRDT